MSGAFGMSKSLGLTVAAGFASALVFLSVVFGGTFGVLLSYLVPLPLMMAGLSQGAKPQLGSAAAAVALVGLVAPGAVLSFVAIGIVPALAVVRLSLMWRWGKDGLVEWYPPGPLLAWLATMAAGLMLLTAAVVAGSGSGVEEAVNRQVVRFIAELPPEALGAVPDAEVKDDLTAIWSAWLPATMASAWLMVAVLNGTLAQRILNRGGRALRPTPAYAGLELPVWLDVGLAAVLLGALALDGDLGYLARNLVVLLAWPFAFAGLATVHEWVRGRPNPGLLLALFYSVFFVLFGWALVAIAGLGLVRHWTRPRRRDAGPGQEEK